MATSMWVLGYRVVGSRVAIKWGFGAVPMTSLLLLLLLLLLLVVVVVLPLLPPVPSSP